MLCDQTIGRAATDRVQMFGCDVWLSVCSPCAKVERAETAYIMALADLIEDEDETGGEA